MSAAAQDLAARFVAGESREVIAACATSADLTASVCAAVADGLVARALATHSSAAPLTGTDEAKVRALAAEALALYGPAARARKLASAPRTWVDDQDAVLELAALPGADQRVLAVGFVKACTTEIVFRLRFDDPTISWMLRWAPDAIRAALAPPQGTPRYLIGGPGQRSLIDRLWVLPGQPGLDWLLWLLDQREDQARRLFSGMNDPARAAMWSTADWVARLDAVADAALSPPPALLRSFAAGTRHAPRESLAAQMRLACVYATGPDDWLVLTVATFLARCDTDGAVTDPLLLWWPQVASEVQCWRWIVDRALTPERQAAMVDAAISRGRLPEEVGRLLMGSAPTGPLHSLEDPWEMDDIHDAGVVALPDGRLSGGDPWWTFEGLPFVIELSPGEYPVRVITARHSIRGRECAAAELLIDADAPVVGWNLQPDVSTGLDGYTVEVGVASFGPAEALLQGDGVDGLERSFIGTHANFTEVPVGALGSLVIFTVGPQHQECRTWIARNDRGEAVRVVSDLGLLDIDPVHNPTLPWA